MTNLTWHIMPADQGQIVEVAYASDGEYLYRRTLDRSDRSEHTERVSWDWLADSVTGDFEPWNGELGVDIDESDWQPIA